MNIISTLIKYDKELFILLNNKHTGWLDPIMLIFSSYPFWILTLLTLCSYMYFRKGRWGKWGTLFLLLSLAFNSLINNIIKIIIARPRPIHENSFTDIIHAIESHSTSYSFFSAHSSNSFCMVVFTILFFKNKIYAPLIILWGITIAYSRIYVGKHYPLDIICGILFGALIGYISYLTFKNFKQKRLYPQNL